MCMPLVVAACSSGPAAKNGGKAISAQRQGLETLNYCATDLSDYVIELAGDDALDPVESLGYSDPALQWIENEDGSYLRATFSEGQSQAQQTLYRNAEDECGVLAADDYMYVGRIPRASIYTHDSYGSSRYPEPGPLYETVPSGSGTTTSPLPSNSGNSGSPSTNAPIGNTGLGTGTTTPTTVPTGGSSTMPSTTVRPPTTVPTKTIKRAPSTTTSTTTTTLPCPTGTPSASVEVATSPDADGDYDLMLTISNATTGPIDGVMLYIATSGQGVSSGTIPIGPVPPLSNGLDQTIPAGANYSWTSGSDGIINSSNASSAVVMVTDVYFTWPDAPYGCNQGPQP